MSLPSFASRFANWVKENFVTPRDYKEYTANKNLHRMIIVFQGLLILFLPVLTVSLFISVKSVQENLAIYIYYFILAFGSILGLIACLIIKRHPKTHYMIKNSPMYYAMTVMLGLCVYIFAFRHTYLNAFIIFTCTCVVSALYVNFHPAFYCTCVILCCTGIVVYPDSVFNTTEKLNILIFMGILIFLCLYRTYSAKKNYLNTKLKQDHLKYLQDSLALAASVQQNFLVHEAPVTEGWKISCYNKALSGISGDFLDFYTDKNTLKGLGIFDISGHGLAAGLVTMLVKNIIQQEFCSNYTDNLDEVVDRINERLIKEKGKLENYLTGIILRMDGHNVEMVSAGHPLPIIYTCMEGNADFFINSTEERYGVLGLEDFPAKYAVEKFSLESGDRIILYTDGITESTARNGETYGKERLLEAVNNSKSLPVKEQIDAVLSDFMDFIGSSEIGDDITMLILQKD